MTAPAVEGWLLSPNGAVHQRANGDRARCRAILLGAVPCTLLAAQVHGLPICPLCFPAAPTMYAWARGHQ